MKLAMSLRLSKTWPKSLATSGESASAFSKIGRIAGAVSRPPILSSSSRTRPTMSRFIIATICPGRHGAVRHEILAADQADLLAR